MTDAYAASLSSADSGSAPASPAPSAPAPAAPEGPNPFADGDGFNVTEQGRLVRENPNLARDFIKAAGKEKDFRTTLERLGQDSAREAIKRSSALDAATDPDARIAQLEHMRKHDHVRFEVKHADEYKALIEAREAGPQDVRPLDATASRQKIAATDGGQELLQEWGEQTPAKVQAGQQSTLEMLNSMGDKSAQGAFMYGVSQLPGPVQTGFARELSSPAPENVSPAAVEAVAEYKAYGVVEKWGADAPVRVARAEARVQRMLKDLPAGNRVAALEWFRSLPANQAAAIIEQLSR
jgi:hypothetical protein